MLLTNADLEPRELIVDGVSVHHARCKGCVKTGAFTMISGMVSNDPRTNGPTFFDLFLTREQAEQLRRDLDRLLTDGPDK